MTTRLTISTEKNNTQTKNFKTKAIKGLIIKPINEMFNSHSSKTISRVQTKGICLLIRTVKIFKSQCPKTTFLTNRRIAIPKAEMRL